MWTESGGGERVRKGRRGGRERGRCGGGEVGWWGWWLLRCHGRRYTIKVLVRKVVRVVGQPAGSVEGRWLNRGASLSSHTRLITTRDALNYKDQDCKGDCGNHI